jgi:cellulase
MRQSLVLAACWTGFAAAHGHLKEWIIDGTTYPAFDPLYDYDSTTFPSLKRIEYGFPKLRSDIGPGVNPVADVKNLSITCRWRPLAEPKLNAVARAGSQMGFKWLDWFSSHKGPVLTVSIFSMNPIVVRRPVPFLMLIFNKFMGLLPESGKVEDVDFFKIDELAYDPKTRTWGSDTLMKNDHLHNVTIPSDLKPGTYVVRHELIALHGAMNDNYKTQVSGAQFYPNCAKVQVIGQGTATPPGGKFPGTYKWDDKGILVNIFFMPNEYISPGGPVYKPSVNSPPVGPKPVVTETGAFTGELAARYEQEKAKTNTKWESGVHNNDKTRKYSIRALYITRVLG